MTNSFANMNTPKSYSETVKDIREEIRRWGAKELYIASAKDAKLDGPGVEM